MTKKPLISFFKNLSNEIKNWPIIQELVKGRFFGFTAICNRGQLLCSFMYEVLRQYPESGGMTVYARSMHDISAFEASKSLIEKLCWTGPIDLDFFILREKGFTLLEINPRFSGTMEFACSCGVDMPLKYLNLVLGENVVAGNKTYKKGVLYRSVFPEEIYSCLKNKRNIPRFLVNFFRPNTHYDFSVFDQNLLLWQIKMQDGAF